MKRALIIGANLVVMLFLFFFIIRYANSRTEDSNAKAVQSFEKLTITTEQIVANYLEDEQHLCDIWANYVNRSYEAGEPMTVEQAIAYIRRAKISPSISGHLIFVDDGSMSGVSTAPAATDENRYEVSYKNVNIFDNLDSVSSETGVVNLTRAYTDPMNGVQSIAFLNYVTVLDDESGELRRALLMRVVPVSRLEQKLVFLKGEYENVEIALIDRGGNYLVHGKSMKNSSFFDYYKSYNKNSAAEYDAVFNEITGNTGSMTMNNYKGDNCLISYTPLLSLNGWYLIAYIPKDELVTSRSVDWMLLGVVAVGFVFLLVFNSMLLMKYNRKLADTAEIANRANEAKSNFLSTMSHDIRTPMNAILGLNEMVLRDAKDESIVLYSENIRNAGHALLGLINDILDFSKIEAGKMEIINVDYSVVSILNDLVNMVQRNAEEKGLSFNLDVDKEIPGILHGDEIRIKQIITNILSNAVKYTKEGSVTFSVRYEKIPEDEGSILLCVSVKDTGIGIKPEDLKRLFVAFERIEEKRNRNIEGTGLGMTIAQSFLDKMGSHLEVESEYGKGSEFSFKLKQQVVKWDPIGDYEEVFKRSVSERRNYREKFTAPHAKILVVDDTPVNLLVFKSLLKKTKVQIDTAESGDECIVLFKQKNYDVIFLDHMMPNKDGIETLQEMKQIADSPNKDTPVVCLTANAVSGMREMYIKAGFDDYLTKPVDPDRLETMLLSFIPQGKIAPPDEGDEEDNCVIPDFIFKIDELDVNSGLSHCGSRDSYMLTVRMYLDTAQNNADEIEKYWAARDIKNTTIRVHALKSTSRVIGALKLGGFAAELEKAGDTGDVETLEKSIPLLLEEYRHLAAELEPLYDIEEEADTGDKPMISVEGLKEAYDTLLEFCSAYDFDSVVHVVESLSEYSIPEDEQTRYERLIKAVDNFDYELIPEIISGGIKRDGN